MRSHMAFDEEGDFVRVVVLLDDNDLPYSKVYPLKAFRAPAVEINNILYPKDNFNVTESFNKYGREGLELEYNLIINKAFKELYDKGILIMGDSCIESCTSNNPDIQGPLCYSNDGFAAIYPSNPPPPTSMYRH